MDLWRDLRRPKHVEDGDDLHLPRNRQEAMKNKRGTALEERLERVLACGMGASF